MQIVSYLTVPTAVGGIFSELSKFQKKELVMISEKIILYYFLYHNDTLYYSCKPQTYWETPTSPRFTTPRVRYSAGSLVRELLINGSPTLGRMVSNSNYC